MNMPTNSSDKTNRSVKIVGNVQGEEKSLKEWLESLPKGCKNFRIVENPKPKKPNLILVKSDKDNQE